MPPGGHIEECELPHETAVREAKEETGISVSITAGDLPATRNEDAFFLPGPLCFHAVKAHEAKGTFYHIDLAYLCRVVDQPVNKLGSLPEIISNEEIHEARWVELDNLSDIPLANNVIEMVNLAKFRLKLK